MQVHLQFNYCGKNKIAAPAKTKLLSSRQMRKGVSSSFCVNKLLLEKSPFGKTQPITFALKLLIFLLANGFSRSCLSCTCVCLAICHAFCSSLLNQPRVRLILVVSGRLPLSGAMRPRVYLILNFHAPQAQLIPM